MDVPNSAPPPSGSSSPSPAPASTAPQGATSTNAAPTPSGQSQTQALADKGTNAANQAQQQLAEAKKEAERRKYRLKVDGAERELELTDADITARLQKALAAEKRMAEAAQLKKGIEQFNQLLETDFDGAVKALGKDPQTLMAKLEQRLAEQYMAEKLKQENPTQYEALQAKKQLEEYKAQVEAYQRTEQERVLRERSAKEEARLTQHFVQTLEEGGLPKNRRTVGMMAEVMSAAVRGGYELTPQQMAAEVRDRIAEDAGFVLRDLRGDSLIQFLGDAVVKEVLAHSIKKAKAGQTPPAENKIQGLKKEAPSAPGENKPRSYEALRRAAMGFLD